MARKLREYTFDAYDNQITVKAVSDDMAAINYADQQRIENIESMAELLEYFSDINRSLTVWNEEGGVADFQARWWRRRRKKTLGKATAKKAAPKKRSIKESRPAKKA